MVFFNNPLPVDDPATDAVRMAVAVREQLAPPQASWRRRGFELGFAAGVDLGYATLGTLGVEGRSEYGAIGPVVHLAARLRDAAQAGQILISQRVQFAVEKHVSTIGPDEQTLISSGRPTRVFAVEHVTSNLPSMASPEIERGPLTARAREVVELIVNGYTNRQIAEALVVAEATLVRHVANILNKLNLTSRAQVAVWAVSHGISSGKPSASL
jgi:DNA-binding CsgD family transcriptional regulator